MSDTNYLFVMENGYWAVEYAPEEPDEVAGNLIAQRVQEGTVSLGPDGEVIGS
jgi:hypothetical protein